MKISLTIIKILLIITTIVSIGSVLGATIYLTMLKKSILIPVQPTLTSTASPTSTPNATATLIPTPTTSASDSIITPDTSNTKLNIYKNTKYGFEFKYENSWKAEQTNNSIEFKSAIKDKPEEISISVNIITNRPNNYTLAGWLKQNGNDKTSCDLSKKINEIEWCVINTERFEAIRADDYAVTKNGIDYDIKFRVAYGRQQMDYYISDKELSKEISVLNQILATFKFTEK